MSLLASLLKLCCGSSSQQPPEQDVHQQQPAPARPQSQQPQAHPQPEAGAGPGKHKQHHKHKPSKADQENRPPARHDEYPPLGPPSQKPPQQAEGGAWQEVKPHHGPGQQHAHSPSPPSSPPHRPEYPHSDQNQINQHNEHYVRLRAEANAEGDKMAKCFAESRDAYEGGDGAGAKQLSNEGKEHQSKMHALNKQASDWIYGNWLAENNKDSEPGEIDLHGLYVKEAIEHTDRAIQEAKARGDTQIHLIVGKGLHSQGHVAKLKPAIEELLEKHQLFAELDPHNAGVLVCTLGKQQGGVGSDEIARRLEKDEEGCTIM